jgi:hypothetical protein
MKLDILLQIIALIDFLHMYIPSRTKPLAGHGFINFRKEKKMKNSTLSIDELNEIFPDANLSGQAQEANPNANLAERKRGLKLGASLGGQKQVEQSEQVDSTSGFEALSQEAIPVRQFTKNYGNAYSLSLDVYSDGSYGYSAIEPSEERGLITSYFSVYKVVYIADSYITYNDSTFEFTSAKNSWVTFQEEWADLKRYFKIYSTSVTSRKVTIVFDVYQGVGSLVGKITFNVTSTSSSIAKPTATFTPL